MLEIFNKFRFTAIIYFGSLLQDREWNHRDLSARLCTLLCTMEDPVQCRGCKVLFRHIVIYRSKIWSRMVGSTNVLQLLLCWKESCNQAKVQNNVACDCKGYSYLIPLFQACLFMLINSGKQSFWALLLKSNCKAVSDSAHWQNMKTFCSTRKGGKA